jgi:hypothetical protein
VEKSKNGSTSAFCGSGSRSREIGDFLRDGVRAQGVGRDDLEFASGIYLSDGVINLALLNYKGSKGSGLENASTFVGAHHFGFQVEDIEEIQKRMEANGGLFFFDLGNDAEKENFERKFKDPDGVIFDVSKKGWVGTER